MGLSGMLKRYPPAPKPTPVSDVVLQDMKEAGLYCRNPLAFWLHPNRWDGKNPQKDMVWDD